MINQLYANAFCKDDISLIENYEKAAGDPSPRRWVCHHRKGIELGMTKDELMAAGLYWHRPAEELIFLTTREHAKLHQANLTEKQREEKSARSSRVISEVNKTFWKGRKHSEEHRRKQSEAMKKQKWWNNGHDIVRAENCPGEGWVRGRMGFNCWKRHFEVSTVTCEDSSVLNAPNK